MLAYNKYESDEIYFQVGKTVYFPKNEMVLKRYFSLTLHFNFIIKGYEKSTIFISVVNLCFLITIVGLKNKIF